MPRHPERGFTLIEAVVALAILGGAGLATIEALGAQVRGADRAREAYMLAALAQDRLTAAVVIPAPGTYPLPDSLARGRFPAPFEAYRWNTTVTPVFGDPDLYRVRVEITSPSGEYEIETLLYQPRPAEAAP